MGMIVLVTAWMRRPEIFDMTLENVYIHNA